MGYYVSFSKFLVSKSLHSLCSMPFKFFLQMGKTREPK